MSIRCTNYYIHLLYNGYSNGKDVVHTLCALINVHRQNRGVQNKGFGQKVRSHVEALHAEIYIYCQVLISSIISYCLDSSPQLRIGLRCP